MAPSEEQYPVTDPVESADSPSEVETGTLKRASFWIGLSFGAQQILRFVSNLILWRLLFPEAFGLMALVNSLLQALNMFSDVGIGPSIVQNERGAEEPFLNTAWTIQVGRGILISAICVGLAGPMASFYGRGPDGHVDELLRTQLLQIVPVVGLSALILGLQSTAMVTEQKALRLGRLTTLELGSVVCASVTMIGWAMIHPSVWALVAGGIVAAIFRMILSHTALPGIRNRLRWDPGAARSIIHFGRWIFVSTLLTFAAVQSDRLIFGKMVPIDVLGVYSIALALATIPSGLMNPLASHMVFPHLSRRRLHRDAMDATYARVRTPVLILAAWMISGLIAGGPTFVNLLYGARAEAAGWMVQVLAVGSWLLSLKTLNGAYFLALGHPRLLATANAAKVVGMLVLIPAGYFLQGFPGAIWGFVLSELISHGATVWALVRRNTRSWRQDVVLSLAIAASCAIGFAVQAASRSLGASALVEGLAIAAAVTALWWAAWAFRDRFATFAADS